MPLGTHLIIDAKMCDNPLLSNLAELEKLLVKAVEACGEDVHGAVAKLHTPRGRRGKNSVGVTLGVLTSVGDSFATLITYPELGKWMADVHVTGRTNPGEAFQVLRVALGGIVNVTTLERG